MPFRIDYRMMKIIKPIQSSIIKMHVALVFTLLSSCSCLTASLQHQHTEFTFLISLDMPGAVHHGFDPGHSSLVPRLVSHSYTPVLLLWVVKGAFVSRDLTILPHWNEKMQISFPV